MADLQRSIPSMADGFNLIQRKILFCAFKKNLIERKEVVVFSSYVLENCAHEPGDGDLTDAIIGMAQDYVGSNNVNLFIPDAHFGSRDEGGKDHARAYYLYTRLSPISRFIFPKEDDICLEYLSAGGKQVEPKRYFPIIPMVLVNGCEGNGTGWSTYVPNYNPMDIIENMRRLIKGQEPVQMSPWYEGFSGTMDPIDTGEGYTSYGRIQEVNNTTLEITELPIRMWTQSYLEFLDSISERNPTAKNPFIWDYELSGDLNICVTISKGELTRAKKVGLEKKFKLETKILTSNMYLLNSEGQLQRYTTPDEILKEFYTMRLEKYDERLIKLREHIRKEVTMLDCKRKFVCGVVDGTITLTGREKADLIDELKEKRVISRNEDYAYITSLRLDAFTIRGRDALEDDYVKATAELDKLEAETAKSSWLKDLDALEAELRTRRGNV